MGEQKCPVEVESDQPLPLVKGQLVHIGARICDDRAAADGIDEDVGGAEFVFDRGHHRVNLPLIEGVAETPVGNAADPAQGGNRGFEPVRVVIDADDDRALAGHDLGSGTADAVGKGGDDRDFVREAHGSPLSCSLFSPLSSRA